MPHQEYIRIVPGAKSAVLMIHGILGSPDHFRDLIPLVPEDWSVHSILLDGHGGAVEAFSATNMHRWKAQVSARLEELLETHENVVIAAHSMGTLFAIQEAIRRPDRIPALFLLGSPLRVFVQPAAALNTVLLYFGYVNENDRSAVDMKRELSVTTEPWVHKYVFWIPRFVELFAEIWHVRQILPQLTVPTQVFQSQKDELVHPSSIHDFEGHPHIDATMLPDSGHFGYGDGDLELLKERFLFALNHVRV